MRVDAGAGQRISESISFLVGPELKNKEFHRATATASLADVRHDGPGNSGWSIETVDADWDDESGRTQVRAEVAVWAGTENGARVRAIAYHVTILAQS